MFNWIDDKYRWVLVNDENFQEERSFRLSKINVFTFLGLFVLVVTLSVILGLFMASNGDAQLRKDMSELVIYVDSLEGEIVAKELYFKSIEDRVFGKKEYASDVEKAKKEDKGQPLDQTVPEKNEAAEQIMESVRNEAELGGLVESTFSSTSNINEIRFLTPLKGQVSDKYAPNKGHFGVDIIAAKGSMIKATQKGTVLVATWSADTGYMLAIQHENNVVSFYKHNSSLLKKTGETVKSGEPIAVIGNTGEMSDGPHLHFELWFNGQSVNPQQYISFK